MGVVFSRPGLQDRTWNYEGTYERHNSHPANLITQIESPIFFLKTSTQRASLSSSLPLQAIPFYGFQTATSVFMSTHEEEQDQPRALAFPASRTSTPALMRILYTAHAHQARMSSANVYIGWPCRRCKCFLDFFYQY